MCSNIFSLYTEKKDTPFVSACISLTGPYTPPESKCQNFWLLVDGEEGERDNQIPAD